MGFLDFVKKKFSKEPEVVEEIEFNQIDEWLEQKYESKKDFLKGQLDGTRTRIDEGIKSIFERIETLNTAQLRNTNIPEKAKHFMEGNRESYIKWTKQFVESISAPENPEEIENFISGFNKRLEEFLKITSRPYRILSEFFEDEVSKVALGVRNIEKITQELKTSSDESKINHLDIIKEEISKINNKMTHKKLLRNELDSKDKRVDAFVKEKKRMEDLVHEKENSKDYKDYQELKIKSETIKNDAITKEAEVKQMFAPLERPMKKYARVVFNEKELLEKYAESPILGLTQDLNLKIIVILDNLKKAVEGNTIELKDKQKEKAIYAINEMDKTFLGKFVSEYAQLRKKENEILSRMRTITVMKELVELKQKLSITIRACESTKKDMETIAVELGKINLEVMKKELQDKISEELKIKAIIS